jgi:hypothetical protein
VNSIAASWLLGSAGGDFYRVVALRVDIQSKKLSMSFRS